MRSRHSPILRGGRCSNAGLVRERREGTRNFYSVNGDGLADLRAYIEGFWDEALAAFKEAAENEEGADRGKDDE